VLSTNKWLGMAALAVLATCGESVAPLQTAQPGVVFTFPLDQQVDVPLGARFVVTFSDPVEASALGSCAGFCLKGPNGPIEVEAKIVGDGKSVEISGAALEPGTKYELHATRALAPSAENLPASGTPLVTFTTRSVRPRSTIPTLVAVNGGDPAKPDGFRPIFESTTIRLLFSEPLDPRGTIGGANAVELVNMTTSSVVPATVYGGGIHVSIDPKDDLVAGQQYLVRLGNKLVDVSGQALAPTQFTFTPVSTAGPGAVKQVLRIRGEGDPGPKSSRSGAKSNVIVMNKPLIGREESTMLPASLQAELGDPKSLGGPIAFTIRKGQRMRATGLDVKLGGQISAGLSTGDIIIELLTDGGGRIYRNPHQPADQRPENDRAPLYTDLSLDVAVYTVDPTGNAVITQTVLGVQAVGTVVATEGVLAIENMASMELPLLGVTEAPTNLVLELITDESATAPTDGEAPKLVASSPGLGSNDFSVDAGIEVIFDEPIDVERARAGGIRLEQGTAAVSSIIESHGAAVVVRPLVPLAYGTAYRVVLQDVADVAGNPLAQTQPITFTTPPLAGTNAPMTVASVYPGAPCALTGGNPTAAGRCAGGAGGDSMYRPFALPANETIEVSFTQSPRRTSVVRGTACNQGAVRVEQMDAAGTACVSVVAGSLRVRDRGIAFIPDVPWIPGTRYRLTLVSGDDDNCGTGELCGANGVAPSFDPLSGTDNGEAGGPALVINFLGEMPTKSTFMLANTARYTDINGNGFREGAEPIRDENRAALRVVSTDGIISSASFTSPDCLPNVPGVQACMYLSGAMPVQMGELSTTCPLPDGTAAASCIPVALSPQAMYATSVGLDAVALITISNDTGTSVMRVRDGATPVMGYIIERNGEPTLVAKLDLYMDAPDLSIPLSSHDLHSKPLSVSLTGPVKFLPDGRISMALTNTAAMPVKITISAPIVGDGTVNLEVPAGEMKLQLISPALRGGPL
jgi:Bacterial Ig-like domain